MNSILRIMFLSIFLSSAYVVSPGPTSQKFVFLSFSLFSFFLSVFFLSFCIQFFHSVSNFLGFWLVKNGHFCLRTFDPTYLSKNKALTSQDCPGIKHLPNGIVQLYESGSDTPLIQDIVPSNAGAWLINATHRIFRLAEQSHTQHFLSGVSSRILML